jgi:hypothetical protein
VIRVSIICEGPTEANFIDQCLVPHLYAHDVYAFASILRAPSGRHKGGRVTIDRLARHISHEYRSFDRLTTLVDFYGFQDRGGRNRAEVEKAILDRVEKLNSGFDPRFIQPYVQMHEFEGLLFSDTAAFEWAEDGWSEEVKRTLEAVTQEFDNPEDINDSPQTAPSKRILSIFPKGTYSKTEHGPLIAEAIGVDAIRAKCPAFNEWIGKLETWERNV